MSDEELMFMVCWFWSKNKSQNYEYEQILKKFLQELGMAK